MKLEKSISRSIKKLFKRLVSEM